MKLELLIANQATLKTLGELQFEDAQLAWDLADVLEEVEKSVIKFHKSRDEYVKENGSPMEGDPAKFIFNDPKAFEDKMKKLLDVEVKIKFPVFPLGALEGTKVSAMEILSWKALGILENPKKK